MGLKSRTGKEIVNTTMTNILDNPFYYGVMKSKGKLMRHIYKPLISKELYEQCQEWREKSAAKPFKRGEIPFLYRGLITCYNTRKICPNEIKKKKFQYLVCYKEDGSRLYIPEKDVTEQIEYILGGIHLPEQVIKDLSDTLKSSQKAEIEFRNREVGRLKAEITNAEKRLSALLDLRLDGELSKDQYESKHAALQLQIDEAQEQLKAHRKADDGFNETLIGLFEIASEAQELFAKSNDIAQKRLLLRFIFDELLIKEGVIYYKLNFPFSEMEKPNLDTANSGANSAEPLPDKALNRILPDFEASQNDDLRTANSSVKTKACNQKSQAYPNWLLHLDSNQD